MSAASTPPEAVIPVSSRKRASPVVPAQDAYPVRSGQITMPGQTLRVRGAHQQRLAELDMPGGKDDLSPAVRGAGARLDNRDAATHDVVPGSGRQQPDAIPGRDPAPGKRQVRSLHRFECGQQIGLVAAMHVDAGGCGAGSAL